MTPTARSLAYLRKSGYLVGVVERWISGANVRRDLFGFADVLAVHPVRREVVLVQVTTLSNLSVRVAKIRGIPELPALLAAGLGIQAHGWVRRSGRWHCKVVDICAGDCEPVVVCRVPRGRGGRWQPLSLFEGVV